MTEWCIHEVCPFGLIIDKRPLEMRQGLLRCLVLDLTGTIRHVLLYSHEIIQNDQLLFDSWTNIIQ